MGCVIVEWISRELGTLTFNLTMTLHGRNSYYSDAMVPSRAFSPYLFSIHVRNADYDVKKSIRTAAMPNILFEILQQLTAVLYEFNRYIQSVLNLGNSATTIQNLNNYQLVLHSNK